MNCAMENEKTDHEDTAQDGLHVIRRHWLMDYLVGYLVALAKTDRGSAARDGLESAAFIQSIHDHRDQSSVDRLLLQ